VKPGRRPRRSPAPLLAALAVAAATAFFLLTRGATAVDAEDGVHEGDSAAADAAPAPVALAAMDATRARRTAAGREANGRETTGARTVTVRGRVLLPDGVEVRDGTVHVLAAGGIAGDVVLASAPLAPDLRFEVRGVRVPEGVHALKVAAVLPGAPTGFTDVVPNAAGEAEVDVDVRRPGRTTRTLSARVVDAVGRPLAGLPVFVESMGDRHVLPLFRVEVTRTGDRPGERAIARTDADGRFRVEAFASSEPVRAGSSSPEWFLLPDDEHRAFHEREATLTAWPAAELDLTVLGPKGEPVPSFHVDVVTAAGARWDRAGRNGRLRTLWPRGRTTKDRVDLDVCVQAEGFEPAAETITFARNQVRAATTVRLAARDPSALGALEVTVVGTLRTAYAPLELRRAGRRARAASEWVHFAEERPTATIEVAEGSWDFRLGFDDGEEAALAMTGRVDVRRGQVTRLTWRHPATGRLSIGGDAKGSRLSLASAEDGSVRRVPFWHLLVVPVGTWTVTLEDENGAAIASTRATVTEGEATTVRLD
jgi:hypothetical protein